ncbi:hypothetical protein [Streptomyces sp. NPDC050121]|uniref:hypothetical protein n=1 Tax=Streptomyces sp. NPDC050121 TaxID=3365601 RepID=UPI0037884FB0
MKTRPSRRSAHSTSAGRRAAGDGDDGLDVFHADACQPASTAGLVPVPRDSGRRTGSLHRSRTS